MNMTLPLEVIERIEITKGSAGRIYGQNAFTGAVNIITKKNIKNNLSVELTGGSFDQKRGGLTVQRKLENSNILFNYNRKESEGYRYNTDFNNDELFIKSNFITLTFFRRLKLCSVIIFGIFYSLTDAIF